MRSWLRMTAAGALTAGLVLVLTAPPAKSPLFLPEFSEPVAGATAFGPRFGTALMVWAVVTFYAATRARRRAALLMTGAAAAVLGLWAVQLAGPFWEELATVAAGAGVAAVWVPIAFLLKPQLREAR